LLLLSLLANHGISLVHHSAGEMSEISMRMDVNAIFPLTLRCRCDADVRIILVWPYLPSNETTCTSTEIRVSDAHIWPCVLFLHACPRAAFPPPPSIVMECMVYRGKSLLPGNDCSRD